MSLIWDLIETEDDADKLRSYAVAITRTLTDLAMRDETREMLEVVQSGQIDLFPRSLTLHRDVDFAVYEAYQAMREQSLHNIRRRASHTASWCARAIEPKCRDWDEARKKVSEAAVKGAATE